MWTAWISQCVMIRDRASVALVMNKVGMLCDDRRQRLPKPEKKKENDLHRRVAFYVIFRKKKDHDDDYYNTTVCVTKYEL